MKNNRTLFYTCLFISIGVHLGAGWMFYKQPLFLRPYFGALTKKPPSVVVPLTDEDIALSEKNISLEDVMSHITQLPMQEKLNLAETKQMPSSEKSDDLFTKGSIAHEMPDKILTEEPLMSAADIAIPPSSFEEEFILPKAPSSSIARLEASKNLDNETIQSIEQSLQLEGHDLFQKHELESTLNTRYSVLAETAPLLQPPQDLELPTILSLEDTSLERSFATPSELLTETPEFHAHVAPSQESLLMEERAVPNLPHSKTPSLGSYSLNPDTMGKVWDEGFDVAIKTMQKEEGGYFFSVTLLPKYDMTKKQMPQNYYFLIDRTNSIGKHRYQTFKKAVKRALGSLEENCCFNIIIFDKKMTSLSDKPLAYSRKSLQMAEAFLNKHDHGTYFNASDLCKSLTKIMPDTTQDNEESSVILITDGDSSLNQDKQRKIIQSFVEKNKGKISLYTAAVGEGNNLNFLDLLSRLNKGYLLYSDTHASFPRKLTKLVIDLLHPIAKDVSASIIKADPRSRIRLYPATSSLPSLFSQQPYTIYGEAESLSDFTLVLQGRNKDELLTIKKSISFTHAKNDPRSLAKQWSYKQAHICYEEYLKSGKTALLEQAQSLLNDSDYHRR